MTQKNTVPAHYGSKADALKAAHVSWPGVPVYHLFHELDENDVLMPRYVLLRFDGVRQPATLAQVDEAARTTGVIEVWQSIFGWTLTVVRPSDKQQPAGVAR